jgi:hypothetical protein
LAFRERAVDDECFFISIDTKFDKGNGELTKEALMAHNFYEYKPPQFREYEDISAAFNQFQLLLAKMLTDHIKEFKHRLRAKTKACFYLLTDAQLT